MGAVRITGLNGSGMGWQFSDNGIVWIKKLNFFIFILVVFKKSN